MGPEYPVTPGPTLACSQGPVGHPWCPPWSSPANTRLLANKARFDLIYTKVSQNAEVSPKYVEKAYVSPCFQNGPQKSPLDFLGFPYLTAFSRKELMGRFDPYLRLYGQNDEVSPMCTPWYTRSGRSDTPIDHGSKLPPVVDSSSDLGAGSS